MRLDEYLLNQLEEGSNVAPFEKKLLEVTTRKEMFRILKVPQPQIMQSI